MKDEQTELKKERIRTLKKKVDAPRVVGDGDVVPFAWRHPLPDPGKRMSKYFKGMTAADAERKSTLPAVSAGKQPQ